MSEASVHAAAGGSVALWNEFADQASKIALGGGAEALARQHKKGRLGARERIAKLIDAGTEFYELGLWSAWEMYGEYGGAPAAGVVTGVGVVAGRRHMLIANDATVKAGAFFPATVKKVISAAGLGQTAAIMGNCVAGGGYLPVLCDKLLMTEGSGLYLAGPALVKSAIGQVVTSEDLGGAAMHSAVSGTIDYREPDDDACIRRLRSLAEAAAPDTATPSPPFSRRAAKPAARAGAELHDIVGVGPRRDYEMRQVLECLVDADSFDEYKPEFGKTLVCGTARIGGFPVGIVANQHHQEKPAEGPLQFGGVLYVDSAEKAARFVMNCNQDWLPLIFLQDVNGFMVGRDSERSGIIKAGAKLVSAVSNSRVPKLTVLVGGSFGAGNYALCGKGFDPRFIFAWPAAKCAVMGADQATNTLLDITISALERKGEKVDADELAMLRETVKTNYTNATDPRFAAARGWVDRIIDPAATREELITALEIVTRHVDVEAYRLGVFQV
jgi:3-methylcrotonyl-CoA carboxylase beta subunit